MTQDKLIKTLDKDIDEFQYYASQRLNNADAPYDPEMPDELYVKSGKNKHFSKNIAIWK